MKITTEKETILNALLALSEGLDFPNLRVVTLTSENPLLRYVAPIKELEVCWNLLTGWMQSLSSPEERLNQLQTAYYRMFLQPGAVLPVYLHLWYPNESPATFLAELQNFLFRMKLMQSPGWRNGTDHLAVVFETIAHLVVTENSSLSQFTVRFLQPWFSAFVCGLKEEASNDFYVAMSIIAREVDHAMETLI